MPGALAKSLRASVMWAAVPLLALLAGVAAQGEATFVFPNPPNGTTCVPYKVVWQYALDLVDPSQTFTLEVTNIDVPQFAPIFSTSTTTSATQSSASLPGSILPTVSSDSFSGTVPPTASTDPFGDAIPTPYLRARQDSDIIDMDLADDIPVSYNSHSFPWLVNVPPGWYIFNASDPTGILVIKSSERFYIAEGANTSCIGSTTSSSSAPGASASDTAPAAARAIKPGVIAGVVVGALGVLGAAAAFWLILAGRLGRSRKQRRRTHGAWGQVNSHDSRGPRDDADALAAVPPGGRLQRAAGAMRSGSGSALGPADDADSLEEKLPASPSEGTRSGGHRYSASSSASGHGARGGSRAPSAELYALGPIARPAAAASAPSSPAFAATKRKAVPRYDAREMAAALPDDETTVVGSHDSHGLLHKQSKEIMALGLGNGSGQLHYIMPDMPPPQRH